MPYLQGQEISDEDLQARLKQYRANNSGAPQDDQSIINVWEGKATANWGQPAAQSTTAAWTQPAEQTAAKNDARNDQLWSELWTRSQQAKTVDRNDPVIKAQADAYSANEERASRDYLADVAEKSGPYANLRGEQRLAAERVGQRTGSMEANLMGQELQSRRAEIASALESMRGMLSADQQLQAQREIARLDAQLKEMGYTNDWNKALMQNDQFNADLGLRAEDRASYWDWLRSGGTE